jgi:hypothetical protein
MFSTLSKLISLRQIESITEKLPRLTEADLERLGQRGAPRPAYHVALSSSLVPMRQDASCPICMNTFLAALAEEEIAYAMDSPAQPLEERGVTRLAETCGHAFCRKELSVHPFQSLNTYTDRTKPVF